MQYPFYGDTSEETGFSRRGMPSEGCLAPVDIDCRQAFP